MNSRLSQEHFKNQEKFDFKNQVSRFKFQESRVKNNQVEDSRIKKRLNQSWFIIMKLASTSIVPEHANDSLHQTHEGCPNESIENESSTNTWII